MIDRKTSGKNSRNNGSTGKFVASAVSTKFI